MAKKAAKPRNGPKRPVNAFLFWFKENRARISGQGITGKEVAKAAGVEWKSLDDKQKWEDMARADRQRYAREVKMMKETAPNEATTPDIPDYASEEEDRVEASTPNYAED